jgi:Ion channel
LTIGLLIGVTLLLALAASGVTRRWRLGAGVFVAIFAVINSVLVVSALATDADLSLFDADGPSPLWVAFALVTPVAVVRRLIQHRRVSTGTLFGVIAGYLLIALAFSYLMLFVAGIESESFFAQTDSDATTSFMYFSLVSMTTAGYGDLTAASDLGRLLATSEAVVGQVYLVAFVAMLVGLFIQGRGVHAPSTSSDSGGSR